MNYKNNAHRSRKMRWVFRLAIGVQLLSGLVMPANAGADPHRLAQGKYLASICATCHQAEKTFEGIAPIRGHSAAEMTRMMTEYKDSVEHHEVMENIAKSLSPSEISALAVYLASLPSQKRNN